MTLDDILANASEDTIAATRERFPESLPETKPSKRHHTTTPRRPDTELETKFLAHWNLLTKNELLLRDYVFSDQRKFEIDFYHEASRVGVEVNGSTWTTGGHSTGQGISRDYQKALLAATYGIIILFVSSDMIKDSQIAYTIDQIWRVIQYRSRQS